MQDFCTPSKVLSRHGWLPESSREFFLAFCALGRSFYTARPRSWRIFFSPEQGFWQAPSLVPLSEKKDAPEEKNRKLLHRESCTNAALPLCFFLQSRILWKREKRKHSSSISTGKKGMIFASPHNLVYIIHLHNLFKWEKTVSFFCILAIDFSR